MDINFGRRFYYNVKRICKEKGLSISEISDRLGIHRTHMNNYARKGITMPYWRMQEVADILGTSVDSLCHDKAGLEYYRENTVSKIAKLTTRLAEYQAEIEKVNAKIDEFNGRCMAANKTDGRRLSLKKKTA